MGGTTSVGNPVGEPSNPSGIEVGECADGELTLTISCANFGETAEERANGIVYVRNGEETLANASVGAQCESEESTLEVGVAGVEYGETLTLVIYNGDYVTHDFQVTGENCDTAEVAALTTCKTEGQATFFTIQKITDVIVDIDKTLRRMVKKEENNVFSDVACDNGGTVSIDYQKNSGSYSFSLDFENCTYHQMTMSHDGETPHDLVISGPLSVEWKLGEEVSTFTNTLSVTMDGTSHTVGLDTKFVEPNALQNPKSREMEGTITIDGSTFSNLKELFSSTKDPDTESGCE